MADTTVAVRISAQGGSTAADELNKVRNGLVDVEKGQKTLAETLAKPSASIVLKTLNKDLLSTIGYTGNARPVIKLLETAFYGLGGAIGATTSAIFPYVAVLAGAVTIMTKVKASHAEAAEAQKAVEKATFDNLKTTQDTIEKLEKYRQVSDSMPPSLAAYEAALKKVNAQLLTRTMATTRDDLKEQSAQLEAAKIKLAEMGKEVEVLSTRYAKFLTPENIKYYGSVVSVVDKAKAAYSAQEKTVEDLSASVINLRQNLIAQNKGFADSSDQIAKETAALEKNKEAQKKAAEEHQKANAAVAKFAEEASKAETSISASVAQTAAQKRAAAETSYIYEMQKLTEKYNAVSAELQSELSDKIKFQNAMKNIDASYAVHYSALGKQRLEAIKKINKEESDDREKNLRGTFAFEKAMLISSAEANRVQMATVKDAALSAYSSITQGIGDSFAQAIVEGKNFEESMKNVFKNVLEQFISMIVQMMVKYAAFKALTGMGIISSATFTAATGTDTIVDRPTTVTVGENGPERIRVSPITGSSSMPNAGGSSQSINITMTNNISGGGNANEIAEQVGRKLLTTLRGLGGVNYTRTR